MAEFDNTNRGILFRNTDKKSDKSPDYSGKLNVNGTEYRLAGWKKSGAKGDFLSISVQPADDGERKPYSPHRSTRQDDGF